MEKFQTNTLSPTGWMITSHYEKDTKNKVLRVKRNEDGIQRDILRFYITVS